MSDVSAARAYFAHRGAVDDFAAARLRWLVRLRWVAMAGVLIATVLAAAGFFPGVYWPLMAGVVVGGSLYNWLLQRGHRAGYSPESRYAGTSQALIDLAMLTTVLWAAGGISSPFLGFYIFHVALIAILGGPTETFVAAGAALFGSGMLALTNLVPALRIGTWAPVAPWDTVAEVVAFVTTLGTTAHIVAHASHELRERESALVRARAHAALEFQLLSNTLDELEAGLEVLSEGEVLWRNRGAERLSRFVDADVTPGVRFAVPVGGQERVYELLSFTLATGDAAHRVMNLYVDRTQVMLSERTVLLAERLASLGRIAQGVAHELNTPLATIRTLATDMNDALRELRESEDPCLRATVVDDLGESAELIRDETLRLGRITQALLAGGELASARIDVGVPLSAVVQRVRALVVAGSRSRVPVIVDPSVDGVVLETDPDRLMQVLVNLVQNAVDAVRDGGGTEVRVRAAADEEGITIVVEDDGPGLDEEILPRLFEPFATTKPPGEGTGLGLYTSYMLMHSMSGDLSVDNREDRGVRATIRLPESSPPVRPPRRISLVETEPS